MSPAVVFMTLVLIMGSVNSFDLRAAGQSGPEAESHPKYTRSVDATLSQPIQVCGLRLLEAVRVICRNRGGYLMTRRSDPSISLGKGPLYEELEAPMSNSMDGMDGNSQYQNDAFVSDSGIDFPEPIGDLWSPSKLIAFKVLSEAKQGQHVRVRRNIIDECCKRPCPRSQMVKYCVRA